MMRIVLSTIDDVQKAQELATTLVNRRLAACVNIIPSVRSVYHWQGTVEEAVENLLILKTSEERLDELMAGLRELHPYDLPEIIALPVETALPEYLNWGVESTSRFHAPRTWNLELGT